MPEPRCHVNMFFMTWTSLLKCQPNIPVRGADSPTLLNRVALVGQTISTSVELAPKQRSTMFLAKSLKTLDCGGSPTFGCTCGPLPAHMTITCQNRFQTLHHLTSSFQITVHPFLKCCPLILITLGQIGQTCQSGAWKAHPCLSWRLRRHQFTKLHSAFFLLQIKAFLVVDALDVVAHRSHAFRQRGSRSTCHLTEVGLIRHHAK